MRELATGGRSVMMDKRQTYDYLEAHGVSYEATERAAVYSMAKLEAVELPYPDRGAKNLFVRDDKKCAYYLMTVKGDKRVNLKEFRRGYGTRPLLFASAGDLGSIRGLEPGSVTPLGLLNDEERKVTPFLDSDLADGIIGVHPNDNTATVWMQAADLVRVVEDHGNEVRVVGL